MIFPWLRGVLVPFDQAPLTWMLVYLNFILFSFTTDVTAWKEMLKFHETDKMILTGQMYYQFKNPKAQTLPTQTNQKWYLEGFRGFQDHHFMSQSGQRDFWGDQIAITAWKKDIRDLMQSFKGRRSSIFGLNENRLQPLAWLTYQFTHSGWTHLFVNCLTLLIFGAALERRLFAAEYLLIYLTAGVFSALSFFSLSKTGLMPLVGASGSISGIMAAYLMLEQRKNVPFFYFLAPMERYFGIIYLPVALMWPLIILPDIVGLMMANDQLGGSIAYAAHLGGAAFGVFYGFIRRRVQSPDEVGFQLHF